MVELKLTQDSEQCYREWLQPWRGLSVNRCSDAGTPGSYQGLGEQPASRVEIIK